MRKHSGLLRRHGFSLVELLVVIGIITIMLGILLPTLGNVWQTSERTKCRAQLGEFGKLLNAYFADQSQGRLPYVNPLPSMDPPLNEHPSLVDILSPYADPDSKVYLCPADKILGTYEPANLPSGFDRWYDREGLSYEYNPWLSAFWGGEHLTDVSRRGEPVPPDQITIMGDFEPFHDERFKTGSKNKLFADWSVGDLGES